MENINSGSTQQIIALIRGHISHLRKYPHLSQVPILLVPESNYGLFSTHMAEIAGSMDHVHIYKDPVTGKTGLYKDDLMTEKYIDAAADVLSTHYLSLYDNMVALTAIYQASDRNAHVKRLDRNVNPVTAYHYLNPEETKKIMMDVLFKQYINYQRDEHGKPSGKVAGCQDDLLITNMMFYYMILLFRKNPSTYKHRKIN
jgi:hypothetical protein